jgi:hypothetical protein
MHLARFDSVCQFEHSVGQSGFAVVNMRNDGKISDIFHFSIKAQKRVFEKLKLPNLDEFQGARIFCDQAV